MGLFVTPKELAEELRVPLSSVYRWNSNETGPTPIKVGKHIRYRRTDVDAWLEANTGERTADVSA